MKNYFLAFALVASFNSFAGNTAGITYSDIDSVDGPGLTLSGVSGNFVYDLDVMSLSCSGCSSATVNAIQGLYAFGDASVGSLYLGFYSLDSNVNVGDRITEPSVGYVRRGSDANFKIGYVGGDIESLITELAWKVGSGNIELNLLNDGDDVLTTLGYTWNF